MEEYKRPFTSRPLDDGSGYVIEKWTYDLLEKRWVLKKFSNVVYLTAQQASEAAKGLNDEFELDNQGEEGLC